MAGLAKAGQRGRSRRAARRSARGADATGTAARQKQSLQRQADAVKAPTKGTQITKGNRRSVNQTKGTQITKGNRREQPRRGSDAAHAQARTRTAFRSSLKAQSAGFGQSLSAAAAKMKKKKGSASQGKPQGT